MRSRSLEKVSVPVPAGEKQEWRPHASLLPAGTGTGTHTFPLPADNSDLEAIRLLARLAI
jgi:hypothetical protein